MKQYILITLFSTAVYFAVGFLFGHFENFNNMSHLLGDSQAYFEAGNNFTEMASFTFADLLEYPYILESQIYF